MLPDSDGGSGGGEGPAVQAVGSSVGGVLEDVVLGPEVGVVLVFDDAAQTSDRAIGPDPGRDGEGAARGAQVGEVVAELEV